MSISRSLFLFFFLFSFLARAEEDGLVRNYFIRADFHNLSSRRYSIDLRLDLTSRLKVPLSEITFVAYPNRFKEELPHLNDLNYRRIYPDGFSPGGIDWDLILPEDAIQIEKPGFPHETFFKIDLRRKPIMPGETRTIHLQYRLKIPEKFGAYGFYKSVLSLSGGWYPYVPAYNLEGEPQLDSFPPAAHWNISVEPKNEAIVGNDPNELHSEVSLFVSPKIQEEKMAGRNWAIRVIAPNKNEETVRPLRELAIRWLEFLERQPEFSSKPRELTVVLAPLRNSLAAFGDGLLYVSDRAFHVNQALEQYHTVPVLKGLFYEALLPQVLKRESTQDYHWVAEALAWKWTERLMKEQNYANLDARTLKPIQIFSFLPTIDQMIYAPQFAYVDTFFDAIYAEDPVRDDPLTFNHQIPNGRAIFAHLEDEVGMEVADHAVDAYANESTKSFRQVAQEVSNRPLEERFKSWVAPRPPVNYLLAGQSSRRIPNGYENEVTIRRESPNDFHEPVELTAKSTSDERIFLKWDGIGTEHTYQFRTKNPVTLVEIDPRGRLLETDLADNRDPPRYKLVLTNFYLNYDFNTNEPEVLASTTFRRAYGGRNRYTLSAFRFQDSYGGDFGYTRLFGRLVDRLRLSHGLGFDVGFNRWNEDDAVSTDPATGNPVLVPISPELTTASLNATYFTGNQLSLTNPLEGGGSSLSATWGKEIQGGDTNYYLVNQGASWIFRLHPSHLLAFREFIGTSGPDDIPSRVQYSLGGIGGIRGLPASDDRFQGRNILLVSGEYRHFLMQHIDLNFWLFRLRDIQGALFSDAGNVTDTVQEKADEIVSGVPKETGFGELFDVTSFSTDFGYSIHFLVDYLGVNPGLLRFDIAKSISEWDEGVRFYFGVTQSF